METPINQLYSWLAENTNLTLTHDITTHFERVEKKYYNELLNNLFEEVRHGDEEHQEWLKAKFNDNINNLTK